MAKPVVRQQKILKVQTTYGRTWVVHHNKKSGAYPRFLAIRLFISFL
ncbi:hypothetical protein SAMN05444487_102184 [Marininema mesophilum]|uniref:Uncharacterized protein n=1 Tax=Marininema mesophilum TaxID=1048340 RepID=A0A1H2SF22_9BACL|nr:hypothetical protein SAMN05444487_102184 [Marininema mesophilum]